MGEPVELGRACSLCGEQVILTIATDQGTYTDDLKALLDADTGTTLVVQAHCSCPHPRSVALEGSTHPTS